MGTGVFRGTAARRTKEIKHFSIDKFEILHSCLFYSSGAEYNRAESLGKWQNQVPSHLGPDGAEVAQRNDMSFATVVDRVRMDFVETPEMELTLPQAVRLWSLGMDDCRFVLDSLVDAGFLAWTPKRTIVRRGRDPLGRQDPQATDISVLVAKRYNKSV